MWDAIKVLRWMPGFSLQCISLDVDTSVTTGSIVRTTSRGVGCSQVGAEGIVQLFTTAGDQWLATEIPGAEAQSSAGRGKRSRMNVVASETYYEAALALMRERREIRGRRK